MVAIGILKNNVFPLFFNLFGILSTLRVCSMSRLKKTYLNSPKSASERHPGGRRGGGVFPLRAPKGNLVPNPQIDVVYRIAASVHRSIAASQPPSIAASHLAARNYRPLGNGTK